MRVDNLKIFQYPNSKPVFFSFVDSIANNSILVAFLNYYIKLSITDYLTGAYNKRYLQQYLTNDLANCYVCMVDVDDFKSINDKLGHVDGDNVLIDICDIIRSELQGQDSLIRFGGDEFIVLYTADRLEYVKCMLRNVQCKLSERYRCKSVHPKISYGIAKHKNSLQILDTIRIADSLMYSSRKHKYVTDV